MKIQSQQRFAYFFNPCTKVIQSIGMDVTTCHNSQKVVFWQRFLITFDEENAFIFQGWRPLCMRYQMAGKVLANHQFLENKIVSHFISHKALINQAWKFFIRAILSFRRRKLTLKLAWISSFLSNILASIDQVFLINFQFRISKIKFWYQNRQLKYFRITRAQFLNGNFNFFTVCCWSKKVSRSKGHWRWA